MTKIQKLNMPEVNIDLVEVIFSDKDPEVKHAGRLTLTCSRSYPAGRSTEGGKDRVQLAEWVIGHVERHNTVS